MRFSAAIIVAVILSVTGAQPLRADVAADAPAKRNPIEWLLSDIGKLLSTATSALQGAEKTADEPKAEKTAAQPAEPAAKPEPEPTLAAGSAPAPVTASEKKFRNPLEWLFNDLARLLQPDLEIDQTTADMKTAKTVSAAAAVANEQTAPVAVAEPAAADTGTPPKNPVAWLFRDLANLLAPKTQTPPLPVTARTELPVEPAPAHTLAHTTAQAPAVAPAPVAVERIADKAPEPAAVELPVETAREAAPADNPIASLFSDIADLLTPKNTPAASADVSIAETSTHEAPAEQTAAAEAVAVSAEQPESPVQEPLAIAPWVPRPESDPFNPADSLFSTNGQPLLAVITPPAPEPAPLETAAFEPVPEKPVIRERAPYRPLQRNHASIGRDHKAVTADPDDNSLVDRVLESLFGIDAQIEAEETLANKVSDRIVPEEKLDLGYTSPDATQPDQELTRIGGQPLDNIDLYMGHDSVIGERYDAATYAAEACVERALQGSVFCLKKLNWPSEIAKSFATDTAFVLPGEGVVRYENGTVSRVYAVFKSGDFADVVKYMQHRFGPPQEREIVWMHMLEAPKLPNTTFRWQAFNADHTEAIVLEVRNYDDLRRSFADMDHGMVRLFRNGSRPIFKHISTMDLMLMQRRRVANAPVEVNQPPKQQ